MSRLKPQLQSRKKNSRKDSDAIQREIENNIVSAVTDANSKYVALFSRVISYLPPFFAAFNIYFLIGLLYWLKSIFVYQKLHKDENELDSLPFSFTFYQVMYGGMFFMIIVDSVQLFLVFMQFLNEGNENSVWNYSRDVEELSSQVFNTLLTALTFIRVTILMVPRFREDYGAFIDKFPLSPVFTKTLLYFIIRLFSLFSMNIGFYIVGNKQNERISRRIQEKALAEKNKIASEDTAIKSK